ncbi:hypothetical protein ABXS75_03180 [Roseburia hominis]
MIANKYVHMTEERIDSMIERLQEAKELKRQQRIKNIGEAALQIFGDRLPSDKLELYDFFQDLSPNTQHDHAPVTVADIFSENALASEQESIPNPFQPDSYNRYVNPDRN